MFKAVSPDGAIFQLNRRAKDGPVPSNQIKKMMEGYRIGDKTMSEVKAAMGIKPYRKMRVWYWALPEKEVMQSDRK